MNENSIYSLLSNYSVAELKEVFETLANSKYAALVPTEYGELCSGRICEIGYGYLLPPLVIVGLSGNLISTAVLFRMLKHSNCVALICLTLLDTMLLILTTLLYMPMAYCRKFNLVCDYLVPSVTVLYPLALIARTSSMLTCMAISVERCLVVKFPLMAQRRMSKTHSVIICTVAVFIGAAFNIPAFFELIYSENCACLVPTKLRSMDSYMLYYRGIVGTIFEFTIPLFVIVAANIILLKTMRQGIIERKEMVAESTRHFVQRRIRARDFTRASVSIVMVFVVSQIIPVANHVIEAFAPAQIVKTKPIVTLVYLGNATVILGAGVNVIMYAASGKSFRNGFKTLCRKNHKSFESFITSTAGPSQV